MNGQLYGYIERRSGSLLTAKIKNEPEGGTVKDSCFIYDNAR